MSGLVTFDGKAAVNAVTNAFDLDGQAVVENATVFDALISSRSTFTVAKNNDEWKGALSVQRGAKTAFSGSCLSVPEATRVRKHQRLLFKDLPQVTFIRVI